MGKKLGTVRTETGKTPYPFENPNLRVLPKPILEFPRYDYDIGQLQCCSGTPSSEYATECVHLHQYIHVAAPDQRLEQRTHNLLKVCRLP